MKFSKTFSTALLGTLTLMALTSCASKNTHHQAVVEEVSMVSDEEFGRLPASECDESKYKECKEARKNDIADRYMLAHNGTLYRRINNATCSITDEVKDFKISRHPNDVAVIYYIKNNDLYLVNKDKEYRSNGQCPSAKGNTQLLMKNIDKYTVTSNVQTTIVNSALDKSGNFKAWDNKKVVYTDLNIAEYQMNLCYGSQGKSFSSYVLFTLDNYGHIVKVKTSGAGSFVKDDSRMARDRYKSISEFKKDNNVCN